MAFLYTINGISGTPRKEITCFIAEYFQKKGEQVTLIADLKGSSYGRLANSIVMDHPIAYNGLKKSDKNLLLYFP